MIEVRAIVPQGRPSLADFTCASSGKGNLGGGAGLLAANRTVEASCQSERFAMHPCAYPPSCGAQTCAPIGLALLVAKDCATSYCPIPYGMQRTCCRWVKCRDVGHGQTRVADAASEVLGSHVASDQTAPNARPTLPLQASSAHQPSTFHQRLLASSSSNDVEERSTVTSRTRFLLPPRVRSLHTLAVVLDSRCTKFKVVTTAGKADLPLVPRPIPGSPSSNLHAL